MVIGHGTYLLVFLFWQRLRTLVCRPLVVFLDKLCVAQHDEELKKKGIEGIAAFLQEPTALDFFAAAVLPASLVLAGSCHIHERSGAAEEHPLHALKDSSSISSGFRMLVHFGHRLERVFRSCQTECPGISTIYRDVEPSADFDRAEAPPFQCRATLCVLLGHGSRCGFGKNFSSIGKLPIGRRRVLLLLQ